MSAGDRNKEKIKLVRTYTEELVKVQRETIYRLDTKHSAFLGFSALLLRFALQLPNQFDFICGQKLPCNSCLIFKILVCLSATFSILISAYSLTSVAINNILAPEELLEDNKFQEKEEETIGYIVSSLIQESGNYSIISNSKKRMLNYSIWLFTFAIICFAADNIIISIYCKHL